MKIFGHGRLAPVTRKFRVKRTYADNVPSLVALDFPLGPSLVDEIVSCAMTSEAFCVLDQRLSARSKRETLSLLGATSVRSSDGEVTLEGGSPVDEGDALVMLTSGSSGTPKAAIHTWASLVASARITQESLRGDTVPVWLPCLPPAHIGGLAVILRSVLNDAELRFSDDLSAGPALGATHISVVRTQLHRYDLSGYQHVLLGGAKPPTALPANVTTTWGMTETGSGIVYDGLPLPEVRVTVINGELCVQSPTLFRRYRTHERPVVIDDNGASWFPTGDAGTYVDGVVSVRGRIGSVITTGGEKVWPEDLEALLSQVEAIADVAVTGVDDPEWGQRVVALVVARDNLDDHIASLVAERIGPWAKPKEIRYVTAIPRTSNGKIRRDTLATLC